MLILYYCILWRKQKFKKVSCFFNSFDVTLKKKLISIICNFPIKRLHASYGGETFFLVIQKKPMEAWNWSCDLRANERPRKKTAPDGPNIQTDRRPDMAKIMEYIFLSHVISSEFFFVNCLNFDFFNSLAKVSFSRACQVPTLGHIRSTSSG